MRPMGVLMETYRNVVTKWVASLMIATVAAGCAFAVVTMAAGQTADLTQTWRDQLARGANVFVVTSSTPNSVSAVRCDQLLHVEGVLSAGAVMSASTTAFASAPDDRVVVQEVTPGYVQVAFPEITRSSGAAKSFAKSQSSGVAVGQRAAMRTGASVGGSLTPVSARAGVPGTSLAVPVPVSFVAETQALRSPTSDDAVLVPVPAAGFVSECTVEADADTRRSIELLLLSWFGSDEDWTVIPLLAAGNQSVNVAQAAVSMSALYLAPIAAAFVLLLYVIITWARRQELAIYTLLGTSRQQLLWMHALEWMLIGLAPSAVGATIAIGVVGGWAQEPILVPVLLTACAGYFGILLAAPPAAWALMLATRTVNALKGA